MAHRGHWLSQGAEYNEQQQPQQHCGAQIPGVGVDAQGKGPFPLLAQDAVLHLPSWSQHNPARNVEGKGPDPQEHACVGPHSGQVPLKGLGHHSQCTTNQACHARLGVRSLLGSHGSTFGGHMADLSLNPSGGQADTETQSPHPGHMLL